MKKRVVSMLLACAMGLSLAACGGSSSAPASTTAAAKAEQPAADANAELTIDQVWPKGTTVYIDVPAKAGGGTDLYTRYLTQALTEITPDVNFVVNNYDTTEVGRENMKNADPDGTHLLVHHAGMFIEYMSGSTNVSAKDDYKTVGIVNMGGPQAIIARPDAPYKNFKELKEYIDANPGDVVVGCTLGGASQAVLYVLFEALGEGTAANVNWVQCGSEADKLTQTASGSIDIANCSIPNALAYEADGKLTILGTNGPAVATLDTMSELVGSALPENYKSGPEQGYDGAVNELSYYCWAPKDTPDNVCKAINAQIQKATEVQSFIDGNKQMATFVGAVSYEDAQKTLEHEWQVMSDTAEKMGVKTR